jgi:hypothetical protein
MTEPASESEFHRAFEKWMRANGFLFITSRMDRASTIPVGDPDYLIVAKGGVLPLELKMPKTGKLSPAQEARHLEYAATGTKVHVIRDLQTAIDLVTAWHSTLEEPPAIRKFPRTVRILGGRAYEERNGELILIPKPKTTDP